MSLVNEKFSSLNELLKAINSRPNSVFMRGQNSSHENGIGFTGTSSYEEAISLLKFGYTDPIPLIKKELRNSKRAASKLYSSLPRPMPRNRVVGYIPNIPNAIRGLPESMITIEKENQKRKTMSILYSIGSCYGTNEEDFRKAGVALVSAINIIELSGIQTRLELGFMPTTRQASEEIVFPTVLIKNYGEKFNIQKICFPMIHPSMFRRIGFKYLETCSLCKKDYSFGYGRVPNQAELREAFKDSDNKDMFIITTDYIRSELDYNVQKILIEMDVLH